MTLTYTNEMAKFNRCPTTAGDLKSSDFGGQFYRTCAGKRCMAWRLDPDQKPEDDQKIEEFNNSSWRRGFCGMAGSGGLR